MDRIFYKSAVSDAYTGYPIYIFDTSYLPVPEEVDYDLFVPALMVLLPEEPYVVVMFSGGLNKINWIWGIKFLRSFLSPDSKNVRNIDNLHMMIAVHESWFVRSLSQIFTNFAFSKWANLNFLSDSRKKNLLVSCSTLRELHSYVDITTLKLSLNVYIHDAQISMSPDLDLTPAPVSVVSALTTFDSHEFPLFYHHFYQVFHIVNTYADNVELLFHRPGNKLHTSILYSCMMRNQLVWINDWDLNCIASCFKKLLRELHGPLIAVDLIPLPIRDDLEYTSSVFSLLMQQKYANEVLFQILELCHRVITNTAVTKHTLSTLLKSLCTVLTHEPIMQQNKFRIAVSLRFFKNLVHQWPTIRLSYKDRFHSVEDIVENKITKQNIDQLFISYDMTMEDASDDDHLEKSISSDNVESLELNSMYLAVLGDSLKDIDPDFLNTGTSSLPLTNSSHPSEPDGVPLKHPKQTLSKQTLPPLPPKPRRPVTGNDSEARELLFKVDDNENENIQEEFVQVEHPNENDIVKENKTNNESDSENKSMGFLDRLSSLNLNLKAKKPEVTFQFPPQKYKFERKESVSKFQVPEQLPKTQVKKPVVRGRKVGELTRLYEERAEAMHILQGM